MITHAVIFAPIGQASRSDQIVQRLANAIITGLLEPNEQLPNETDLAKMMGVSHITIREALNTLRANELIYTVRGRKGGSFVCENVRAKSSGMHPFKSISTDYLSDLGEMHSAIISHSARLASRRVTEADIARLREFVLVLKNATTPEQKTQSDMRCLLALAASSHSARLANQELQLQAEWASLVAVLYRSNEVFPHVVTLYEALIEALASHDELNAMTLANRLIDTFIFHLIDQKMKYTLSEG
ncbi:MULTISPECIES: FadR/GntR family transcriptional regulator [unclassified Leclercia]|uniref:FadR family transcriptional regulator n=1 Tax=Leclercia barmai TaxID=2785629 RepID=A0ABS7RZ38_9ENTR|nr:MULTISPECIES: GntR family transcriptional regulator [unclassified Leclercia]MBZ0059537.1 FadR family transcriptional regulator [Leclercia sp. EMC7]MCM5702073.1 GntR family transcriptional regulator [Leclercia sp. LTM14]